MNKRRTDWFLPAMAAVVALAFIYPHAGARGGCLYPELLNKLGVSLIFFLHGAGLSFAALRAGSLRWRLHLVVQSTTFVLFPLIGLCALWALDGLVSRELAVGVFFLCALPSTVSSSVALTAAAHGNVPAAVFNATTSNLLGVFATPAWLGAMLGTMGQPLPVGSVILDLCLWLVLPLALGQLARPWLGGFITAHKKGVQVVDRATILLLIYTSFCDSVTAGIWAGQGLWTLLATLALCLLLLGLVMMVVQATTRAVGFPREDRITAVFCGSKKTLASGVPMAQLIFAGHPGLGVILLPLMLYHPLQLVVCGSLAARWAQGQGGVK